MPCAIDCIGTLALLRSYTGKACCMHCIVAAAGCHSLLVSLRTQWSIAVTGVLWSPCWACERTSNVISKHCICYLLAFFSYLRSIAQLSLMHCRITAAHCETSGVCFICNVQQKAANFSQHFQRCFLPFVLQIRNMDFAQTLMLQYNVWLLYAQAQMYLGF